MFNITHHLGAKKATLPTGEVVQREEKLFVPQWQANVPCVPYHDHFIYHTVQMGPAYKCTCGAIAVVANVVDELQFACINHMTYGQHATGGDSWV